MTKPAATASVDHARDPGLAEDLVQETYAAAIASLHRFEGRSALRSRGVPPARADGADDRGDL